MSSEQWAEDERVMEIEESDGVDKEIMYIIMFLTIFVVKYKTVHISYGREWAEGSGA